MASVSGVNSSALRSIYGNRNVLSGLASGMDTESMIENAVSGIKLKITGLQQKRTKIEWQQQALRSIVDKMANFTDKYTSYASSTNLLSTSFFNSAVKAAAGGKYADQISATGKTSSDVRILGVKQLAEAATYKMTIAGVGGDITGTRVELNKEIESSTVSGTLMMTYGSEKINLTFDAQELYKGATTEEARNAFKADIEKKLMEAGYGDKIKVTDDGSGNFKFEDASGANNSIKITGASGKINDTLKIDPTAASNTLAVGSTALTVIDGTVGGSLSEKEISVTLDGVTKQIKLPVYEKDVTTGNKFVDDLQMQLDQAFGAGKVDVKTGSTADDTGFTLKFSVASGSTLGVFGLVGKTLGLDSNFETSYLNPSKTLENILGSKFDFNGIDSRILAEGDPSKFAEVKDAAGNIQYYLDEKGKRVIKEGDQYYRVDDKGAFQHEFKVNGKVVGEFSQNTTIESVMTAINSNTDAGVSVTYSRTTNQFQFVSKETGANNKIEFEGLSMTLFGDTKAADAKYVQGKDAIFSMEVNGEKFDGISRSDNNFDVDGLKVTLKGTFGEYGLKDETGVVIDENKLSAWDTAKADATTFTFSTDMDKVVNVIKDMVKDYNEMVTEIKNAYSTLPLQRANGKRYEPLTEEDQDNMSESAIKAYEERAKQGLLFADRDLSELYQELNNAVTPSGTDGSLLRSMGIDTSFSQGLTTLTLDEDKLRSVLESDPDKVRDAFVKTKENGAPTDGLIQSLKNGLDMYGKVTGRKGILVERAGSVRAPATIHTNVMQDMLDEYDSQIDRWTTKLSDQIDHYTSKFSQMEQLIAQMNSQSSTLAGLMGGG